MKNLINLMMNKIVLIEINAYMNNNNIHGLSDYKQIAF